MDLGFTASTISIPFQNAAIFFLQLSVLYYRKISISISIQGGDRMRNKKGGVKFFVLLAFIGLVFLGFTAYAAYTGKYTTGSTLPQLTFEGLTSAEDQGYLGVKGATFTLADVSAKMILIDAMSVL
jgi:hypothetical protein